MGIEIKEIKSEIMEGLKQQGLSFDDEQRTHALNLLQQGGLPGPKHEEYRFTPIPRYLEKNFDWQQPSGKSNLNNIQPFLIKGLDANVVVLVNGSFSQKLSKIQSPELKIHSLADAFAVPHPVVQNYFGRILPAEADPFAAMNTAFWQDGVVIHVEENRKVEKPVFILHVHDATQAQVKSHTRVLAVLEKGSELTVIEKSDSVGSQSVFHNFSEEWVVKENAHLEYCKVQQDNGKICQVTNTVIHQDTGSLLNTFTLTLDGQMIRNNLTIHIDGENCESHFYGLYLLKGKTHADNHTVVDHRKPNSMSNELYKGVLDGQAKGVFNGKIFVRPHAQKTNAFQSNRNILISNDATINTKPQLEIWADDVKCSHGCTSGQLDEEAMFYLRSRGIAEPTAKAMLLYAFANEVLTPIQNETFRNYLDNLIAERLHKDF